MKRGEDDQGLQEFITKQAVDYQEKNLGVSYLVRYNGNLVGYVTLAMVSIDFEKIAEKERPLEEGRTIQSYPALIIGRLAIDKEYRGKGFGSFIVEWCIGLAQLMAEKVGCRYLVLHARDPLAVSFYKKNHFVLCEGEESHSTKLMIRKIFD